MSHDLPYSNPESTGSHVLTQHARQRMFSRGLSTAAIDAGLAWGRTVHVRGAEIYAIGRREVAHAARDGVDLTRLAGLQVVCHRDGAILTVYKNKDFRLLRPRRSRGGGGPVKGH